MDPEDGRSLARAVLDASADGILLLDDEGVVLTANAAAGELLNRDSDTLVGETLGLPTAGGQASGGPEIQVVRPGGELRTVELRTAVTDWEGRSVTVVALRDVTERLRTNQELRESQELLAQIAENAEGVFFVSGVEGELLYVSSGLSRFGSDPSGWRDGGLDLEVVHPDDQERVRALVGDPGRAPYEIEYRIEPGPEEVRWVRQRGFPVKDDQGRLYRVVGWIEDVTERRLGTDRLEEARRVLFQTVSNLDEAVVTIDTRDGRRAIVDVNPATERIFGYGRDEMIGRTTEFLHRDRESFLEFGRRCAAQLRESGVFRTGYSMRRKDGAVFESDHTVSLLDPEAGMESGAVSVVRDVSERKQAEERFGVLIQEITDVIFVLGADGVIRATNPSAQTLGGFRQEDLEAQDGLSWVYPEDREAVRDVIDDIAPRPGAVGRVTHRVVTAEGEVRHMESVVRNRLDHPAIEGIIFTSRDITERLELEEQFRQSQKMEAVGRLAGGIAHDFNNLLTVIRSQTDLLLMDLAESSPLRDEVEGIQASADRAARLTSQLLAFSRDQVLRPRVVNLNDVVRGMGDLLARIIGADVRIVHDLEPGIPPIRIDPSYLEQVVLNLAVNARDAMARGGVMTLETGVEEIDQETADALPGLFTGPCVVLRVADTGVGMDEAVRQRIFEPFYTTKGTGKGTGLGLSMAYGFVRQSGGAIHAESALDEGTVIALRFPVAEGAVEPEEEERSEDVFTEMEVAGVVLVVEDDPDVRRVISRILERAGIEVEAVEDAETAVERLRTERKLALLLTDLVLPGMSGRGLMDIVQESHPDLPIIMMSGYAEGSPGERGDLPEEVAFIQKPFSPEQLLGVVRNALVSG